jgi:hypothetical protein
MPESEMYIARRAPDRELHFDVASYLFFFSLYFAHRSWIALRKIRIGAAVLMATMVVAITSYAAAQELPPLAHSIVGGESEYTVKPGDNLLSIGARKGIERKTRAQHPYQKKNADPPQFVHEMAATDKLDGSIDWKKAEDVTFRSDGIAREIDATSH